MVLNDVGYMIKSQIICIAMQVKVNKE